MMTNVNASPTDTYSSDNRISERSFSLVKFKESVNHGLLTENLWTIAIAKASSTSSWLVNKAKEEQMRLLWKANRKIKIFSKKLKKNFFLGTPFLKHVATLTRDVECPLLEFTFRPTGQKTDPKATLDSNRFWPFFHISSIFFSKNFFQNL